MPRDRPRPTRSAQPPRTKPRPARPRRGSPGFAGARQQTFGVGSALTFSVGTGAATAGTVPGVVRGGQKSLVARGAADAIGVTHDRYILFQVRSYVHPTAAQLAQRFIPYLPI